MFVILKMIPCLTIDIGGCPYFEKIIKSKCKTLNSNKYLCSFSKSVEI
jgi:hypothetical protein